MRFGLIAVAAAAALFSWFSWHSDSSALANSGFLGTWCRSGSSIIPQQPDTITDSPRLIIKSPNHGDSYAHYSGSQLVAERWAQTATLSSDANKITWTSGEVWVRCTSASTAATPEPERLRINNYIVRNYNAIPIHLYKV